MSEEWRTKLHLPVCLTDHVRDMTKGLDMEHHRVALTLKSTDVYFISAMLQEWDNAFQFLPEGDSAQPTLVFKDCVELLRVVPRHQMRRRPE